MGCEDFMVRLSSESGFEAAVEVLRAFSEIQSDSMVSSLPDESHFRYSDPGHIIEIEVAHAGSRTSVTVHFAACHPSTIDSVFAKLVVDLVTKLNAEGVIAEDVEPDDAGLSGPFSTARLEDLRAALMECIPKKRRLWQIDFGSASARVSCKEAIDRFVIGDSRGS